jgi:hypothetical protein
MVDRFCLVLKYVDRFISLFQRFPADKPFNLRYNLMLETGEVPEWLNGTVSKTVVGLVPTVGSNPTLSAAGQAYEVCRSPSERWTISN